MISGLLKACHDRYFKKIISKKASKKFHLCLQSIMDLHTLTPVCCYLQTTQTNSQIQLQNKFFFKVFFKRILLDDIRIGKVGQRYRVLSPNLCMNVHKASNTQKEKSHITFPLIFCILFGFCENNNSYVLLIHGMCEFGKKKNC